MSYACVCTPQCTRRTKEREAISPRSRCDANVAIPISSPHPLLRVWRATEKLLVETRDAMFAHISVAPIQPWWARRNQTTSNLVTALGWNLTALRSTEITEWRFSFSPQAGLIHLWAALKNTLPFLLAFHSKHVPWLHFPWLPTNSDVWRCRHLLVEVSLLTFKQNALLIWGVHCIRAPWKVMFWAMSKPVTEV